MLIAGHSSVHSRIPFAYFLLPKWSKLRKISSDRPQDSPLRPSFSRYCGWKPVDQIANLRQAFFDTGNTKSRRNPGWKEAIRSRAFPAAFTILLGAGVAQGQALFQTPGSTTTFSVGSQPSGVAVADFAHSGYSSIVVANTASDTLTLYLANGPGTFASPTTISTCSGPGQMIAADFNNDGYPDIAVACTGASEVEIFLNNKAGGFSAGTTIAVGATPVSLAAGDFNSDGYQDLVVACGSSGVVTLLLTDGASLSTSQTSTNISNPGSNFTAIVTGKFDSSGHLDVAVADAANSVVFIVTGDGAGNYTVVGNPPVQGNPSSIVAGDWDHNGTTDLAVLNSDGGTVSILSGNGDDTFTPAANTIPLVLPHADIGGVSILALDVNGDGNLDLVADSVATNSLYMLLGNGDGTFQPSQQIAGDGNNTDQPTQQYRVTGGPAYIAVGDFNRDGKPDLAVSERNAGAVALLMNNTLPTPEPGGDSFAAPSSQTSMNGNMADSIAVGDFNHDGYVDTAISYLEDNVVRVLLHGNTATVASYPVGNQPYDVVSGDLNGDGYADLVVVNTSLNSPNGTVSVLMNNADGSGTFKPAVNYTVGRLPYQVAIGDLNGDGIPDLAITNYGPGTISILYGSTNGTFTSGPTLTVGSGETNPYGIAIGDFSNNGTNDIAVTCYSTSQLYVFPNIGNSTFGAPYTYATDSNPAGLVVGDFNRDGKLDIVTGNTTANDISFFAGNGDGTFQPGVISSSLNFPVSIAAGDVNGDGILDIVGVAPNYDEVVVTLGKGDGTFGSISQRQPFPSGQQPWALALGDFNNDGKLDIATANTYDPVNLVIPAYQQSYMTQYPPVTGGNPSVNLMLNTSGTQIAFSESPNDYFPIADSAPITLTATVSSSLGGTTPTGAIIFEDNSGVILGTAPTSLNSSGTATLTLPNMGSGLHIFTALYSGDANYQPNNTAANPDYLLVVAGSTVSLRLQSSTVAAGSNLAYSVTVGTSGGGTDPTGTITLYGILPSGATQTFDSAQTLVGNGNGTASVSNSVNPGVPPGNYELYAVYTPGTGSAYSTGSSSNQPLTIVGLPTSTTLGCAAQIYFGFPTGEDECYSQVFASGVLLEQGSVAFAINGGSQNVEAIQDVADYYSTPTLIGYYATYIFTAPVGSYTATAAFQPELVSGTYYAGSSAAGTF